MVPEVKFKVLDTAKAWPRRLGLDDDDNDDDDNDD